jgi:hypothetical protein
MSNHEIYGDLYGTFEQKKFLSISSVPPFFDTEDTPLTAPQGSCHTIDSPGTGSQRSHEWSQKIHES